MSDEEDIIIVILIAGVYYLIQKPAPTPTPAPTPKEILPLIPEIPPEEITPPKPAPKKCHWYGE